MGVEIGIVYCKGVNINEKIVNEGLARILIDHIHPRIGILICHRV
jgi:hypothetical protein